MGSGKTTVGKRLAQNLGMQFIDLDSFIENRYHKSVSEIFAEKGETGFREIERNLLQEVAQFEQVVISTGGGTPCFFDNMAFMNCEGETIYLQISPDELLNRLLRGQDKRPLIKGKTPEELKSFILENLEERESFYRRATHVFHADRLQTERDVRVTVDQLATLLIN
jgi:shikimate kinase